MVILAQPKMWCLVLTKRKILRLVSTRRQVLTDIVKISERVVSGKPRERRQERASGPVLYHMDVRTPHARGMFGEKVGFGDRGEAWTANDCINPELHDLICPSGGMGACLQ